MLSSSFFVLPKMYVLNTYFGNGIVHNKIKDLMSEEILLISLRLFSKGSKSITTFPLMKIRFYKQIFKNIFNTLNNSFCRLSRVIQIHNEYVHFWIVIFKSNGEHVTTGLENLTFGNFYKITIKKV